jgi:hypothetical protein
MFSQPMDSTTESLTVSNILLLDGVQTMKTNLINASLLKKPSALLPLVMSVTAIALVLGHAVIFGVVHEVDEGTAAHIFQILLAAQLPIVAYFILKWLPKRTRESLLVLTLQAGAWLAAIVAVHWLT